MAYQRPILIGEVLFDCYPDGSTRLGGAPLNVAWHLQGFGLEPLLISAVGNDELGDEALATIAQWGLDLSGISRHPHRPTGRAWIHTPPATPTFDIPSDQAFDAIDAAQALSLFEATPCAILYHGSLLARSEQGLALLQQCRRHNKAPVVMDVNLRAPWFDIATVADLLRGVRWAKVSADELDALSPPDEFTHDREARWCKRLNNEALWVTYGGEGAAVFGYRNSVQNAQVQGAIVDTLGAGDAFTAMLIVGLIHAWPIEMVLERAQSFAAHVCTYPGAIRNDPALYNLMRQEWSCGC